MDDIANNEIAKKRIERNLKRIDSNANLMIGRHCARWLDENERLLKGAELLKVVARRMHLGGWGLDRVRMLINSGNEQFFKGLSEVNYVKTGS